MYQLARGPKTGKELRAALRMKWVPLKGTRKRKRRIEDPRFVFRKHTSKGKVLKHINWLMEKGYVQWTILLVPQKMLWRTVLITKRCYGLTEKGKKYIWKWIRDCGF